ncbi:MAG TPA: hypothetical protein VGO21_05175 [Candidatus Paceibacterota bacterium]|nr:hypothetical protein [Candidatus Paceibacterota bacterium]
MANNTSKESRALERAKTAIQNILDMTTKMRNIDIEKKLPIRFYICDPDLRAFIISECNGSLKEIATLQQP